MEVVCLILDLMLPFQPCSHAFWVLMSLHLFSFYWKYFLLFLFFFSESEYFFGNTDVSYTSYESYNHKCIKVCSPMKVNLLHKIMSIIYKFIIILFHLQMMYILYFTYNTVCSPTRSSVSHYVNHSVIQCSI